MREEGARGKVARRQGRSANCRLADPAIIGDINQMHIKCVRCPLFSYIEIWNSHVGTFPLRISGTWHSIVRMAAKCNLLPHC